MKNFKFSLLIAIVMTMVISVGYANSSPPKSESYPDLIATGNEQATMSFNVTNESFVIENHVDVLTVGLVGVPATLPAPKVSQLNKFIHFHANTNLPITTIESRCRSDDMQDHVSNYQTNQRNSLSFVGDERIQ